MYSSDTKILIVDDTNGIRTLLKKSLMSLGFTQIYEASGAEEALQILQQHTIGLVLTDIVMPKKDGLWLVEQMSQNSRLSSIPTIVVSAESDKELIMKAIHLGLGNYIIKPATTQMIEAKLKLVYQKYQTTKSIQSLMNAI